MTGLATLLQAVGEQQGIKRATEERKSQLLSAQRLGRIPSWLIRFRPPEPGE